MSRPWFDGETGVLLLDEYVADMPSFRKIMEDQIVTDREISEHAERTAHLLRRLEEMLSPDAKEVATEALCELAVQYALAQMPRTRAR